MNRQEEIALELTKIYSKEVNMGDIGVNIVKVYIEILKELMKEIR